MGRKGQETKERMLRSTRDLMEDGGYFAAGLNQILTASETPRGSMYFHFPAGKDQLVTESLRMSGEDIAAILGGLVGANSVDFIDALFGALGDRMETSGWRKGCPVATVALDVAASNDVIQQACSGVYADWEHVLASRFADYGRDDADKLATATLTILEGAMLLARVHRSKVPLDRAAETIKALLEQ
jgi:TetR/AcrR family transcriptional regulator, lmrAB and yxaGH operons repressor